MRWHTELTGTCSFQSVGGQVTAVVECVSLPTSIRSLGTPSQITYEVRTYDPATGKQRTATPVSAQGFGATVDVLSYAPAVLHVRQASTRGSDKLLVLGDDGHTQATIDAGGTGALARLDLSAGAGFGLLPHANYVITQGTLVVKARQALTYKSSIQGYSLADGHLIWNHSIGSNSLEAMTIDGDQAVALTESGFRDTLTSYRLSDGSQHQIGVVQLDLLTAQSTLFAQGKTYAIVDANGDTYPPVAVVK
jgi:hypothetical protein